MRDAAIPEDQMALALTPIGSELVKDRSELFLMSKQLQDISDVRLAQMAREAEKPLREAIPGIAVIGQVKAGKTTLINALTRRPEFLPSDVNPWTAVVTRLIFDNPTGQKTGARFNFFGEDEWDMLINRGGRLGELAENFQDDYKQNEIFEQIELMKTRARMRLSDQFDHILGRSHRFSSLNSEILSRYVCAGDDPDGTTKNPVVGRYSDVTKSADLFLGPEPFSIPLAILDTPGMNDPLLVREEMTQQSLERADIFVLVLSAHQAFTKTDAQLVRLLHALRLDRLVVFINRVDELRHPETEIPEIEGHVRRMLSNELPGEDVPIISGSAVWATYGLTGHDDDEIFDDGALSRYAKARGIDVGRVLRSHLPFADDPMRAQAFAASGITEMEEAISGLIHTGPGTRLLDSCIANLINVAKLARAEHEVKATALDKSIEEIEGKTQEAAQMAKKRLPTVEELIEAFTETAGDLETEVRQTLNKSFNVLRGNLNKIVVDFGDEQAELVREMVATDGKVRRWECDLSPLRTQIHTDFLDQFRGVQKIIVGMINESQRKIAKIAGVYGLNIGDDIQVNTIDIMAQIPSTAALAQVVALDLNFSWLKNWWGAMRGQDTRAKEVKRLILKEFHPICSSLMQTAMSTLIDNSLAAVENFKELQMQLATTLEMQMDEIKKTRMRLEASVESGTLQAELANQQKAVAEAQKMVEIVRGIQEKLEDMHLRVATMSTEGQ